MTVEGLRRSVQSVLDRGGKTITLVIPGRAHGNTKRLAGRSGPRGEIVSECEDDCLVAFNCAAVLRYLEKA